MKLTANIAKHLRDVHFGGNWTCVNLRDILSEVTWQQAIKKTGSFNTILALAYHIHYYVNVQLKVLQGKPLDAHDKFSFDHPSIASQQQWQDFLTACWNDAEALATLIESLPENNVWDHFTDEKYGTYYRNILGLIEHTHYHLGQITLIKKLLSEESGK